MWNDWSENNFSKLAKQKVSEEDNLLLPNFSKPLIIFCDALGKGIGFYLSEEEKTIATTFLWRHDIIRFLAEVLPNWPRTVVCLLRNKVLVYLFIWKRYCSLYGSQTLNQSVNISGYNE